MLYNSKRIPDETSVFNFLFYLFCFVVLFYFSLQFQIRSLRSRCGVCKDEHMHSGVIFATRSMSHFADAIVTNCQNVGFQGPNNTRQTDTCYDRTIYNRTYNILYASYLYLFYAGCVFIIIYAVCLLLYTLTISIIFYCIPLYSSLYI